jgi:hypothetical protein
VVGCRGAIFARVVDDYAATGDSHLLECFAQFRAAAASATPEHIPEQAASVNVHANRLISGDGGAGNERHVLEA